MSPILNIAMNAASKAGNLMVRYLDRLDTIHVDLKNAKDFVSEVDRAAEQEIVNIIKKAYPDHSILCEESGEHKGNKDYVWIIDPLDGTTNYIRGIPHFAVSIAFQQKGKLQHALIYDPIRQETFTTTRGEGARVNNQRRLRVSQNKFDAALLATGFPVRHPELVQPSLNSFNHLMPKVLNIRSGGSAALDLAWVAAGRLDGFWEMGLKSWDLAAGVLLIIEAGGLVSDVYGGEDFLANGTIATGNTFVHKPLLQALAESIT